MTKHCGTNVGQTRRSLSAPVVAASNPGPNANVNHSGFPTVYVKKNEAASTAT